MKFVLPKNRVAEVALLIFALTGELFSHDFYILPSQFHVASGSITVGFHNGDSFPDSEVAPVIARLKDAVLQSSGGTVTLQDIGVSGKRVIGSVAAPKGAGVLILSAHTSPNFIELSPDKFLDYLKEEGLNEVIEWRSKHGEAAKPGRERYSKFAKSLLVSGAPDDFYEHTIGFPIEIVPEANPYTLRPGGQLSVRVMFRGKPAVGLQLEAAWSQAGKGKTSVIGRTDRDGRINVPIQQVGKWRLHCLTMERCSEPAVADWESYWSSLTFEIR